MPRWKLLLVILMSIVVGIGTAFWIDRLLGPVTHDQQTGVAGGDFTLQSADGPVSLHDFAGDVAIVYFGYTSCPDICPTSLTMMASAFKQLSPEELAQVHGIFVSVDPERDTLQGMKEYAGFFHPSITGVTGTPEAVKEIADRYNVIYRKVPIEGSAMGYAVDHSSTIYVVGRKGNVVDQITHGASPEVIAASIRQALAAQ